MVQAPQRTAFSGPALIRLLARLTDVEVPESSQSLSDRLSQWLGWTDAIALSSALNNAPPAVAAGARAFGLAEENECDRVRASLAKAIVGDSVFAAARRGGPAAQARPHDAPAEAPVDYAVVRQRYLAMQQAMETGVGSLRGRLRAMLAAKTPAMARLAVVDAVMERALSERERSLLAAVPGLLAGHFERLREAEQQALAGAEASADAATAAPAAPIRPGAWLDAFRKDMQSVLLAELDVRLQPVEGLLAALRTS
ncbi:MAG: hypothetical protein QOF46_2830 [Paraburkholderia sp.]|jgi:hypothetical protein|nr:hypothetical protein [Paraburkholderia sp.]